MCNTFHLESVYVSVYGVSANFWHKQRARTFQLDFKRDAWQAQYLVDRLTRGKFSMLIYQDAVVIGNGRYTPETRVTIADD